MVLWNCCSCFAHLWSVKTWICQFIVTQFSVNIHSQKVFKPLHNFSRKKSYQDFLLFVLFYRHLVLLKLLRCQTQSTTRARLRLMGQTMRRLWMTRKYSEIFWKFCPLEEYFRICHEKISVCSDYVLSKTKHRPKIGIICGSGLGKTILMGNFFLLLNSDPIIGGLADLITNPDSFPYEEIPGFPQPTVEGKSVVDKIL